MRPQNRLDALCDSDGNWLSLGMWVQRLDDGGRIVALRRQEDWGIVVEFERLDGSRGKFAEVLR